MRIEVREEGFICPVCYRHFLSFAALRSHFNREHNSSYCPICDRYYRNLAAHYYYLSLACKRHAILFGLCRTNYNTKSKSKIYKGSFTI